MMVLEARPQVAKEHWFQFAFGPLLMHGGLRDESWWIPRMQEVGFQIEEEGRQPATLFILAKRM